MLLNFYHCLLYVGQKTPLKHDTSNWHIWRTSQSNFQTREIFVKIFTDVIAEEDSPTKWILINACHSFTVFIGRKGKLPFHFLSTMLHYFALIDHLGNSKICGFNVINKNQGVWTCLIDSVHLFC